MVWLLGLLLVAAGALAYANSFSGVFTFDDFDSIVNNRTIRHLAAVRAWLHPPGGGITVSGRPGVNFTLAINWAWSGKETWSYHVLNLAGHLAAGLILFGIVRRTLQRLAALTRNARSVPLPKHSSRLDRTAMPAVGDSHPVQPHPMDGVAERSERFGLGPLGGRTVTLLAWAIALLWTLHPLQTESVTYIVQRAEMLMGLCYLGTWLCFIRFITAQEAERRKAAVLWAIGCVLVCAAGMTCKEVMVSAPVILLLYDRTFWSGSFAEAWRRRRIFWLGLAGAWLPLVWGVLSSAGRGGTAGFGSKVGVSFWQYAWTQGPAILRYFRLTVWPHPLVLDYGLEKHWLFHRWTALPANAVVAALAAASLIALWRAPRWGFLGFFFFAILAPTSLVPGNRQSLAEHRMYLALVPLIAVAVLAGWRLCRARSIGLPWALGSLFLLAAAEGAAVHRRNADFHSDEELWRSTVRAVPNNAYAHTNLGGAYYLEAKWKEARAEFLRATEIDPHFAPAQCNLGMTYEVEGDVSQAIAYFRRALEIDPRYAQALNNLGVALAIQGHWSAAVVQYQRAIKVVPDYADAELNWGVAERMLRDFPAAEAHIQQALTLAPTNPEAWYNLGLTYHLQGKTEAAARAYAEALRLQPNFANAQANWGAVMLMEKQSEAAKAHLDAALALDPDNAEVLIKRGMILAAAGKPAEAAADYRHAIRIRPAAAEAWANLGMLELDAKHVPEAAADLTEALRLDPASAQIRYDYALVLSAQGNREGAMQQYQETLKLDPDLAEPRNNLATQYAMAGKTAEASAQWEELVRRHPEFAPGHLNLGLLYRGLGRTADAQREFDRAKQLGATVPEIKAP